ncbi:MAG: glycosyltransferase [Anaerolineaceae bacterium]|nr:glycosyltransferase [Anaerolineaceae bacterium]
MRVAFFLPSLAGGGAEKMVLNLIRGLQAYDCEIDLLVASSEGEWKSQVPNGINLIDLISNRVLFSIPKLMTYLRKSTPDILCSAIDHANIIAIISAMLSRTDTKIVISIQRMSNQMKKVNPNKRELIVNWLKPILYPEADQIVCVSDGVCDEMETAYRISKSKLRRIYNPILTEELLSTLSNQSQKNPRQGGSDIVAVGRLEKVKDFPTLISAMPIVIKQQSCKLTIYGEGPERKFLINMVNQLNLNEVIKFPGFVPNIFDVFQNADLCVVSSIAEGFGNVIVEAFACGLPVVSTDCPSGPREILQDGKYGTLVPVGDEQAMAKAILSVLHQKTDRAELMKRAGDFTIEKKSAEYYALFQQLLAVERK